MKYTKKQKDTIRKCAPTLANALFDEDNKEDKKFIYELEIRRAIKNASFNGDYYLGLNRIAHAIKEGIKEDLPYLIRALEKICPSKIKKLGK